MEWYGIHQPVHGIHLESPWNPSASTLHSMDSIWNNPGRVKYCPRPLARHSNPEGPLQFIVFFDGERQK